MSETQKKIQKTLKLEKALINEGGLLEGTAIVVDSVDSEGDRFAKDVKINLIKDYPVFLYRSHDPTLPYASTTSKAKLLIEQNDNNNLIFEAYVNLETSKGKDLYLDVKDDLVWGVSCGFYLNNWEESESGYIFKEITIYEISLTHIPAERKTSVTTKEKITKELTKEEKLIIKNKKIKRMY